MTRHGRASGSRRALRVLIADGNRLIVAGIRRALEADNDIEVVGEAFTGEEVIELVARTAPDVALIDVRMPKVDGMTCLQQIHARYPQVHVVMCSTYSDAEHIQAALSRGAAGYIVKTIDPRDIPAALRQAVEGNVYHAIGGTADTAEHSAAHEAGLTERELAILRPVARGLSNQAIGRELWVTEQTVKFHLTNIYRKLGVSNRTEAARYAYTHHLVDPEEELDPGA